MGESAPQKRKPQDRQGGPAMKKSKGGNAGKWSTPHQKAKTAEKIEMGKAFDVHDQGIWVTFARGMDGKAVKEFKQMCEEYGEELYNIKPPHADQDAADDDEEGDIEASIEQELSAIKAPQKQTTRQVFTPVSASIECVFFMKTMPPVDPGRLVLKICEDARDCPDPMQRRCKYINRLTPVFDTDRATEKGIEAVGRAVLGGFFDLNEGDVGGEEKSPVVKGEGDAPGFTYAIRHNIRNHTTFKSDVVIKKLAGLIAPRHKVNLTTPDKVILVEIFQLHCGISVVDAKQWEDLKRYNMNGLYALNSASKDVKSNDKPAKSEDTNKAEVKEQHKDAEVKE